MYHQNSVAVFQHCSCHETLSSAICLHDIIQVHSNNFSLNTKTCFLTLWSLKIKVRTELNFISAHLSETFVTFLYCARASPPHTYIWHHLCATKNSLLLKKGAQYIFKLLNIDSSVSKRGSAASQSYYDLLHYFYFTLQTSYKKTLRLL